MRFGFGCLIRRVPFILGAGASVGVGLLHGAAAVKGRAGVLGRDFQLGAGQVDDHILGGIHVPDGIPQRGDGLFFGHAAHVHIADVDVAQNLLAVGVLGAADEQQNHEHNDHHRHGAQGCQHQLGVLIVEFHNFVHPLGLIAGFACRFFPLGGKLGLLGNVIKGRTHLGLVLHRLTRHLTEGFLNLPVLCLGGRGGLRRSEQFREGVLRGKRLLRWNQIWNGTIGHILIGGQGLGRTGHVLRRHLVLVGFMGLFPGQIPIGLFNFPFLLPVRTGVGKFTL